MSAKSFVFSCLCLGLCLVALGRGGAGPAPSPKKPLEKFRVAAYLPDYRVATLDPAVLRRVTDLIFFSLEPTPDGGIDSARLTPVITAKLTGFQRRYPLRLWAAFGGWERSSGFAPMTTNAAHRQRFVQALTQFCVSHHFDGADFDWEHPSTAQEEAGYTALLTETHRAFAPRGLRLSVTIAPWQKLAPAAIAAVDAVNLMSYDHEGRHSTFAQAQADTAEMLRQGVPAQKLCLGLPFYGRDIAHPDTSLAYADIAAQYHPAPAVDQVNSLYFNGIQTIRQKTRYARDYHLGGVMVWELGQDAPGNASLLKAIEQAATVHP